MTTSDTANTVRRLLLQIAQGDATAREVLSDYLVDRIDGAIADFVAALQASEAATYARRYPNLAVPAIQADKTRPGQRFTRIVEVDTFNAERGGSPSRRVVCFVERATGLIWKAASFKKPVLNYPRGQVFDLPKLTDGAFVADGQVMPPSQEGREAITLRGDGKVSGAVMAVHGIPKEPF